MPRTDDVMEADAMPGLDGGGSAAGALVAQGATLMRVENDAMLAIAVQRPRNERKVLQVAIDELHVVPEEAKRAYYSIPYREKQPDGSYKMVPVEGPSIKAAMALARRWGNCSVTARALHEDATGADIAGVFVDFETNFRVERPFRASKVMNKRGGGTWTLNAQQWLASLQAAASKAARNATINGLPAYLVAAFLKQARTIAAGDPESKADPKKVASVINAFKRYEVTQQMLEAYLGNEKPLPVDEWMGDDLATLIGLGNAIKDGQITVAEAFDLKTEAPAASGPATATNGLTPEAVAGGAATGKDGATPGAQTATSPQGCDHPGMSSKVDALPPGGSVPCERCGEVLPSPNEREPGADDDDPTPTAAAGPELKLQSETGGKSKRKPLDEK